MSDTRWGCPWHGLVENGVLQTPDGPITIGGVARGDTHLIDFGMPAVETPEAHKAKGMEWLSKAIISGGRLHGTMLPENSWIWRDNNSENWLVEVENTAFGKPDGQPVSVKLKRFGVLGRGAGSEHLYTVAMPAAGADYAAHYGGDARPMALTLIDVSPAGDAAVFGVSPQQLWYASWAELKLSGTGENCTISLSLVRSASVTAGTRSGAELDEVLPGALYNDDIYHAQTGVVENWTDNDSAWYPVCSGSTTQVIAGEIYHFPGSGDPPPGQHVYRAYEWSLDSTLEHSGLIFGMTYSPEGALTEISATYSLRVHGSSEPLAEGWGDTTITTTYTGPAAGGGCLLDTDVEPGWARAEQDSSQANYTASIEIYAGGTKALEVSHSASVSLTGTVEYVFPDKYEKVINRTWASEGRTVVREDIYDTWRSDAPMSVIPRSLGSLSFPENPLANPDIDCTVPAGGDKFAQLRMSVARYSNNTFGIHKRFFGPQDNESSIPSYNHEMEHDSGSSIATPGGERAVTEESGTGSTPSLYASYNPITGQAARSRNRVNWI